MEVSRLRGKTGEPGRTRTSNLLIKRPFKDNLRLRALAYYHVDFPHQYRPFAPSLFGYQLRRSLI
jgi:hypothetical protein